MTRLLQLSARCHGDRAPYKATRPAFDWSKARAPPLGPHWTATPCAACHGRRRRPRGPRGRRRPAAAAAAAAGAGAGASPRARRSSSAPCAPLALTPRPDPHAFPLPPFSPPRRRVRGEGLRRARRGERSVATASPGAARRGTAAGVVEEVGECQKFDPKMR